MLHMNVLVLSPGADTGGQGYRIKKAFDKFGGPDWSVRAMHASDNYIKYPYDVKWTSQAQAKELYDWADVVHHNNRLDAYVLLDQGQLKATVTHHHGTRLRDNCKVVRREDRSVGAVPMVSTIDLQKCYPEAVWLPAPFDIEFLQHYRQKNRRVFIRICQAPTNRRAKSTERVLEVVDRLSRRHDIRMDLVEQVEWKVALSRKGHCDIFIDQFQLGYGNNAIEAWAMGIPVISGVSDEETRTRMIDTWGELPFYETSEANLEQRLEELILNAELRSIWGEKGQAHVMKWHEESQVVELLKQTWSGVPASRGAHDAKLAAVR